MAINLTEIFGPEVAQIDTTCIPIVTENPLVTSEVSTTVPEPSDDDPLSTDAWYPDDPDPADCFVPNAALGGLCSPIPVDRRLKIGDRHPAANPCPLTTCDRCGSTDYRDLDIHGNYSLRRECVKCGRFLGWPKWYGLSLEPQGSER